MGKYIYEFLYLKFNFNFTVIIYANSLYFYQILATIFLYMTKNQKLMLYYLDAI